MRIILAGSSPKLGVFFRNTGSYSFSLAHRPRGKVTVFYHSKCEGRMGYRL